MECFVEKESAYSYYTYVDGYSTRGNIIMLTDIKPGETYAISFGSPTEECWICEYLGGLAGGTALSVVTIGGAIALGLPTGGIGTVAILFAAGYFAGKGIVSETLQVTFDSEMVKKILSSRTKSTIYLTTLEQIQSGDYCNVVE